tara:strand:- start:15 stop:347 length:333 start_codon:yes stop_codon:yes gene_type:complete
MANTFKVKTSRAVGASVTKIGSYDVPSSTQTTVIGLSLANITASAITVEVDHFSGTTATRIVKDAPIPVGGSLLIGGGDQKIVLEVGHSIRVTSSAASSVDAVMSILEIA